MKKTNFFKLFLVGAVALTLGFSSCQDTVSQKDFEAVCKDIDLLKTDVDQLKKDLAALGTVVRDVKPHATDPTKLTVTYTNGNSADITIPAGPKGDKGDKGDQGDQGPKGDPGTGGGGSATSFITINDAGNWVIDGVDTGEKASELAPRINTTTDDHFWEFPVVGADNKIEWVAGPTVIAAAYAVETEDEWILYLPTKDHTELQAIHLVKENGSGTGSNSGVSKIDILGWVESKGEADENISLYDFDASGFTVDENGLITGDINTGTTPDGTGSAAGGKGHDGIDLVSGDKTFGVNFAYISQFPADKNNTYVTSKTANDTDPSTTWVADALANVVATPAYDPLVAAPSSLYGNAWDGGKNPVEKYMVLNTLAAERKGLLVQVHPLTAKLTGVKLTAENSMGELLPVAWGEPELVTGLLTRAAGDSALWFIPGESTTAKYPEVVGQYTKLYKTDALYTLVTPEGLRSEYTPFTFVPNPVKSLEAPVEWIVTTDEAVTPSYEGSVDALYKLDEDRTTPAPGHKGAYPYGGGRTFTPTIADKQIDYVIETNKWYKPEWDATDDLATIDDATTNAVIDWYMELVDGGSDYDSTPEDGIDITVSYIEGQFGLKFNATKTAFQVTRLPDNLTLAWFDVNVYKLGVDGVVYLETVRIRPVRSDLTKTINLGAYPIVDLNYEQSLTDAAHIALYDNTVSEKYLSGAVTVDLKPMFDSLALKIDGQGSNDNLAQRWQNPTYGAKDYVIRNMKITDTAGKTITINGPYGGLTGSPASDLSKVLTNTETALINGGQYPDAAGFAYSRNAFGINPSGPVNTTGTIITGHNNRVPVAATATTQSSTLTKNLWEFRSITIQPQYSVDNVQILFDVDSNYQITIDFFDRDGDYLNTLVLQFKPVIPTTDLIQKDPRFWNEGMWNWTDGKDNVLNAFYKDPNFWQEGMAPNGTRYDIALGDYSSMWSDGNIAAGLAGGNGGFKKFGTTVHSATEWAVLNYTPKYNAKAVNLASVANAGNVESTTAFAGVAYPTAPATGTVADVPAPYGAAGYPGVVTALAAGAAADATVLDNTITLFNQYVVRDESVDLVDYDGDGAQTNTAVLVHSDLISGRSPVALTAADKTAGKVYVPVKENYYGSILHMDLDGGAKYLDVYPIANPDVWEFDMRVMSALYEGTIEEEGGEPIEIPAAAAGATWQLTDAWVHGLTYNKQRYSLFQYWRSAVAANSVVGPTNPIVAGPAYKYTYIDRVEWEVPTEYANVIAIVDAAGAPSKVAVPPTETAASYVNIAPGRPSQTSPVEINVKVFDRFGKVKQERIQLVVTVGE